MPGVSGVATYLRTDTHWTPQAMEMVASSLAKFVRSTSDLPLPDGSLQAGAVQSITAQGDLVAMLNLPDPADLYSPLRVDITPVVTRDSGSWAPQRGSELLLLGDSFTNIYSVESMGFGTHAGFAEHLSLALGWPIDRIAQNAGGAVATRKALADDLARHYAAVDRGDVPSGRERLADTRVVVWQFAMRELLLGDWKPVQLPDARQADFGVERVDDVVNIGVNVTGRIADMTHAPEPSSVPYKDAVIAIHLVDVRGLPGTDEIVVYGLGLSDRSVTALDAMKTLQSVTLDLVPWQSVESQYGGLNRIELDDPDFTLIDLPLYWSSEPDDGGR